MPINNGKTMEQIFVEIARNHGAAMQNGKMLVSVFCDLSQNTQDQRLVRYFAECDGPAELLAAKSLSPAMQQARFQQTVNKISAKTLIPEESARRVCDAFWCATGGSSMVQSKDPSRLPETKPAPESPKTQHQERKISQQGNAVPLTQKQPSPWFKARFLMTKQEQKNGGDYYVYFDDGTRQLVYFPPNAQNNQSGLPRRIEGNRDVIVWKPNRWEGNPLLDYSDGRLEHYVKMDFLCTIPLAIGLSAAYLLAIYIGIPAIAYLVNWIMEEILSFDLLMRIDFRGFGLSALAAYYRNTYTFHLKDIWDWIYLVLMLIPLGKFSLFGYDIISESWNNRKTVQKEIQRRKNCPDRQ